MTFKLYIFELLSKLFFLNKTITDHMLHSHCGRYVFIKYIIICTKNLTVYYFVLVVISQKHY